MTNPYDPQSTDIDEEIASSTASIWSRIKRVGVGILGVAALAWTPSAAYVMLGSRTGPEWWAILACLAGVFAIGLFTTYYAFRGSDNDIDNISGLP